MSNDTTQPTIRAPWYTSLNYHSPLTHGHRKTALLTTSSHPSQQTPRVDMNQTAFLAPFPPRSSAPQRAVTNSCPHAQPLIRHSGTRVRIVCQEQGPIPAAVETIAESNSSAGKVVEKFWQICNTNVFTDTLPLFTENAVYHDTLYPTPFVGKSEITKHMENMELVLPKGARYVLDDLAIGEERVGARWHVETSDGFEIPLSRGASMYTVVNDDGEFKISEAWDFVETPFKVAGIILPVLSVSARILNKLRPKKD